VNKQAYWIIGIVLAAIGIFYFRSNIMKTLSSAGLAMLTGLEGFSAMPYNDPPGSTKWSVGYGHQIQPGEDFSAGVTADQASSLLAADTAHAQSVVSNAITAPLDQSQFDALTSFVYNIGSGAFLRGTIPAKINAGDLSAAADTIRQYIHAGGAVSPALIARRQLEAAAFA
jgi:lysozyme